MLSLVRTVFSRLHSLDPAEEEEKLQVGDEDVQDGEIRMTVSTQDVPDEDRSLDVNTNVNTDSQSEPKVTGLLLAAQDTPSPNVTRRSACEYRETFVDLVLNDCFRRSSFHP